MSKSLLKQLGLVAPTQPAHEALRDDVDASKINNGLILRLAEQAHEANRVLCIANGDTSQVAWADADKEIRVSAIKGVLRILQDDAVSPEASHVSWMETKLANGWKYGETKDEEAKTHPCLVPYAELPVNEQLKDNLFVVIVEAGLGIAIDNEEDRSHHGTTSEAEVETVAAECMALMRSMETLEVMADTLESAPVEQMNETNAALINTVVQGVVGQDEGERMMPSAESYGMGSKRILAAYAKEGVMDKIKEGVKNIIEKIISLIQKFWQWLTMNHKRVRANLKDTVSVRSSLNKRRVELKMENKWHRLTSGKTVSLESVNNIAEELDTLCEQANEFVTIGFKEAAKKADLVMAKSDSMGRMIAHAFKGHQYDKESGTITLYENINKRRLTITLTSAYRTDSIGANTPSFLVELGNNDANFDYDDTIVISNTDVRDMQLKALDLLDTSEREFAKINRLQDALKLLAKNGGSFGSEPGVEQRNVFASYNRALIAFIDGIYTEALRHGVAVTSLCVAFAKSINNVPGSQNSKGFAF